MIEPTAKVLIGTAFYVAILWVAQRNPRAAGMMLTFPMLNGLVLLMAGPAALEKAAAAMLLMPPFNAAMWASYLTGFDRLTARGVPPSRASALLIGAFAIGWTLFAAALAVWHWGVATDWQLAFVLATVAAGIALTIAPQAPQRPRAAGSAIAPQSLAGLIDRYRWRIAIFALSLAAIAAMNGYGASPALLGAVAGAPLVSMFGMQTLAGDARTPLPERRASFAAMGAGLWLGPGIAVLLVAGYWRALAALSTVASGVSYHVLGAALLFASWAFCILAIWSLSAFLHLRSGAASQQISPRIS